MFGFVNFVIVIMHTNKLVYSDLGLGFFNFTCCSKVCLFHTLPTHFFLVPFPNLLNL